MCKDFCRVSVTQGLCRAWMRALKDLVERGCILQWLGCIVKARLSVGSLMSEIMIVTKYGKSSYFGKCFYAATHYLVSFIQFCTVYFDSVHHLEQLAVLHTLWHQKVRGKGLVEDF